MSAVLTVPSVVAIHQPNFFPWLGYFAKLAASDIFVLLDDAQLPGKSGSWVNRTRILTNQGPAWATAAIARPHPTARINETGFSPTLDWRSKLLKTLQSHYGRAGSYRATMALLEPLVSSPEPMLSRYNAAAITTLAHALGLPTQTCLASSLKVAETGTKRLVELVRAASGSTYLSGDGAAGYQEDELFEEAGLGLRALGFQPAPYAQAGNTGEFVPGLSIIDALMNIGVQGVQELLGPYVERRG